jgi:predicted HTH domain antitoxin
MTRTLKITYGDELLKALNVSAEEFGREARHALAAKLYEMGRLSSGYAAQLAGMGRVEFLMSLSQIGVATSNLDIDDLREELAFGRG